MFARAAELVRDPVEGALGLVCPQQRQDLGLHGGIRAGTGHVGGPLLGRPLHRGSKQLRDPFGSIRTQRNGAHGSIARPTYGSSSPEATRACSENRSLREHEP